MSPPEFSMPGTTDARHTASITATTVRAEELAARLRRVLSADAVVNGTAECARFAVAGRVPLVVVAPRDVEGISAALVVASEMGAAIVPWGGGTRQALGCPPKRYDLALSLARLDAIIEHDPASLTITVQAGITHALLNRRLGTSGQMLLLDVARPRSATLGGTLACDTPGLRASCCGSPCDLALGLRVLDAAGDEVNADDVGQLQVGALGTLGVIVEARLKLAPLPETEATLLGIFGDASAALEAATTLALQTSRPCALAIVRAGGLAPLAHLAPTHGGRALLAARLSGDGTEVARAGQAGRAILRRAGARTILSVEPELQEAFWGPVLDFTQTAMPRTGEALLRVEAPPAETEVMMRYAIELAGAYGLSVAELADMLSGRVWLRLRPRTPNTDVGPSGHNALARSLPTVCTSLRERWPRTVILDCPPTLLPEVEVWGMPPPAATRAALRAARQRLDPAGLLNPGRFPIDREQM